MELPLAVLRLSVVLFFSILFSTAEALLNRITKGEVKDTVEEGGSGAEAITNLLQNPRNFMNTIIVAKSCLSVGVVIGILALVGRLWPSVSSVANFAITIVISAIILIVFVEMIPKFYVRGRRERAFINAIFFLRIFYVILYPVIKLLTFASYIGVRILGGKFISDEESLTSQADIETLTAVGDSEEILEEEEREMIHGIFELETTVAREIMTPRTDMVYLDISTKLGDVLSTVVDKGHSRIPVYEDNIDNVIGILHVKDLLQYWNVEEQDVSLESIIRRPPLLVPETKKIDDLLQEFRTKRTHIAIVLDEYGGTAGLVTIEDIIEEIIGEIQDEYDEEERLFEELADGAYLVDARAPIDEINNLLEINLPSEASDSMGGFVINHLGRVPKEGEIFSYDDVQPFNANGNGASYKNLQVSVVESDERRISRVKVKLIASNSVE